MSLVRERIILNEFEACFNRLRVLLVAPDSLDRNTYQYKQHHRENLCVGVIKQGEDVLSA